MYGTNKPATKAGLVTGKGVVYRSYLQCSEPTRFQMNYDYPLLNFNDDTAWTTAIERLVHQKFWDDMKSTSEKVSTSKT